MLGITFITSSVSYTSIKVLSCIILLVIKVSEGFTEWVALIGERVSMIVSKYLSVLGNILSLEVSVFHTNLIL